MTNHFGEDAPLTNLEEFKSWIVVENDDFLVLNKPGWLVCHPSKNGPMSSLVGAARVYLNDIETVHLISRLDRETSGLVILAKHKKAASISQKAIEDKKVSKKYLAILHGKLEGSYTVSQPLADDKDSAVVVKQACAVDRGSAKAALTIFKPLRYSEKITPLTLCEVQILTGRKHQIRAHAQWIGHDLVGDKIYGPDDKIYLNFIEKGLSDEELKIMLLPRQALHAYDLDFSNIIPNMHLKAAPTSDFEDFMIEYGLGDCSEFKS